MPFVKRTEAGEIVAVSQQAEAGMTEEVSVEDEEVRRFLTSFAADSSSMDTTDQDFIRVLEDVVELLVEKGVIMFTELPQSAQNKMMQRRRLRNRLFKKLDIISDD